jgi:hypothetical protein
VWFHKYYPHQRQIATSVRRNGAFQVRHGAFLDLEIMTDTIRDGGRITDGQGRGVMGYTAVNIVIYYYTTLIWAVRAVFYSGAITVDRVQ